MAADQFAHPVQTLVYSYGAKPPVEGADIVDEQVLLAHRYYNRLIELRRQEYDARHRLHCKFCPEIEAAEAALSAAVEEVENAITAIRRRNAGERRKRATVEEQAELGALKELHASAASVRREARAAAADCAKLQAALAALKVEYHGTPIPGTERRKGGHFKDARAACGIPWGTYLEVEKAVESATKGGKGPPAFRRWSGDGLIAVQLQGGITADEAMAGTDRRFRIGEPKSRGKQAPLAMVSLRVGSEGRSPIWATVPVYLHRPLPADAIVLGAALVRRQVAVRRRQDPGNPLGKWAPYYEWTLNVTIRTSRRKPMATDGACGVDLGWRLMPDGGLRVAYVVGSDGAADEICMQPALLARWQKCEDLQSIRDQHFNEIRASLGVWLAEAHAVPDWLIGMTASLAQWRNKARLVRLLDQWTGNRFENDGAMYEAIRRWCEHDVHLWRWERHNRLKAQRCRLDSFRSLAAHLRMRYRRIHVEDCDWRMLTRLPDASSNATVNATSRYWQRIAAVGLLRECLLQAGAILAASADTTRECHVCGHINRCSCPAEQPCGCGWRQHLDLLQTCLRCGEAWDQDGNAARVLLARGKAMESGAVELSSQAPNQLGGGSEGGAEPSRGTHSKSAGNVALNKGTSGGRWQRRKANRSQANPKKDGSDGNEAASGPIPLRTGLGDPARFAAPRKPAPG
jgi:hypothetical protein